MISTGVDNTYGRTVTKLLDYAERDKAQPGEVMMDYSAADFGHLYMKSKTTNAILDLEQNLNDINEDNASKIKVTIDGEITTLYDLLYTLKLDLGSGVKAVPAGTDIIYIQKQYAFDQLSIETVNNMIQLKGFDLAPNLRLPIKKDGMIQWVTPSDLSYIINNGLDSDPTDGNVSNLINIDPLNGKIYLLASKRHLSKNLTVNCEVILPVTVDSYVEIDWCLVTNSFAPALTFGKSVTWATGSAPIIATNSIYVFTFKTWTNGDTWVVDVNKYSN